MHWSTWVTLVLAVQNYAFSLPLEQSTDEALSNETTSEKPQEKDLYVIRKVVYEIGILTDADNSSTSENTTHEQIDVTFFDPQDNGTFVDLSNIPLPVQTNVSGIAVTGIIKSDLGSILFPSNGTMGELNDSALEPLFPNKQIKVTRNITTVDRNKGQDILSGLNDVLGLTEKFKKSSKESSVSLESSEESSEES